jgi:hypothetical protein
LLEVRRRAVQCSRVRKRMMDGDAAADELFPDPGYVEVDPTGRYGRVRSFYICCSSSSSLLVITSAILLLARLLLSPCSVLSWY